MENPAVVHYPDWLNSTLASDAADGKGVMAGWIRPLKTRSRVVGPAIVALANQNDNLLMRHIINEVQYSPGYILVVGGQEKSNSAMIGNILSVGIQNLGIIGFITDGLVRDSNDIRQLDLQVWCRGITPRASAKHDQGVIGGSLMIGGVSIRDNDLVIADDDGVVVWPQENIAELIQKAKEKLDYDENLLLQIIGKKPSQTGV